MVFYLAPSNYMFHLAVFSHPARVFTRYIFWNGSATFYVLLCSRMIIEPSLIELPQIGLTTCSPSFCQRRAKAWGHHLVGTHFMEFCGSLLGARSPRSLRHFSVANGQARRVCLTQVPPQLHVV